MGIESIIPQVQKAPPPGAKMLSFPSPAFLTPSNQEYHTRNCLMFKKHRESIVARRNSASRFYCRSTGSKETITGEFHSKKIQDLFRLKNLEC
ncbi:hypothetical protein D1609_14200 [Leptospira borgpetersenii serovar Hardjo-bovis]|nr:hypothetical protein B9T54_14060 [Leptospira borgpetersenii serovar Hardjo-bovis]AYR09428.1 hypothetical protein D1609_14200 [Leptospira borgpetersenii serovar Hardjo-bovis]TQE51388.1 hypothetical protein FFZ95_14500 [Leptospira borgpetersenii]TQE54023.1 hypothetical protein FFZ96_14435 [Leptospira borgpetersenii]